MAYYGTYCDLVTMKDSIIKPGTDSTVNDTEMLKALEQASRLIDEHCHRLFYVSASKARPFGDETYLLTDLHMKRCGDYVTLSSIKMDDDLDGIFELTLATTDYHELPFSEDKDYPKLGLVIDKARGQYAGWSIGYKTIQVTAQWGFGDGMSSSPYESLDCVGTLANTTTTSLVVSNKLKLAAGQILKIDSELLYVKDVPSATVSVVRGINDSTAATHSAATVNAQLFPPQITEACLIQASRYWKRKNSVWSNNRGKAPFGTVEVVKGLDEDAVLLLGQFIKRPLN